MFEDDYEGVGGWGKSKKKNLTLLPLGMIIAGTSLNGKTTIR